MSLFHNFRQTELQRLKEALTLQKQKREDLNNYKLHVQTEYQENTVSFGDTFISLVENSSPHFSNLNLSL